MSRDLENSYEHEDQGNDDHPQQRIADMYGKEPDRHVLPNDPAKNKDCLKTKPSEKSEFQGSRDRFDAQPHNKYAYRRGKQQTTHYLRH